MKLKTIAQHAAEHLREHGHQAIMWGDVILVHEILDRAGRPHRGSKSCNLLLNALERSSLFRKVIVQVGGRALRSFELQPR